MQKLALVACLLLGSAACAQAPTDRVELDVTRAELQIIAQGLMKLPYETAAPLLVELQKQLDAQTPKVEAPAPAAPAKK